MATVRDLALDANGDLLIVGQDLAPLLADTDAIVSDVQATLKFMLGEWFADLSQGIPWFQTFQSKRNVNTLRNAISQAIAARQGITQVQYVTIAPSSRARTATISWAAFSDISRLPIGATVTVGP